MNWKETKEKILYEIGLFLKIILLFISIILVVLIIIYALPLNEAQERIIPQKSCAYNKEYNITIQEGNKCNITGEAYAIIQ